MSYAEFITYIAAIGIEAGLCGIIALSFCIGYKVGKGRRVD